MFDMEELEQFPVFIEVKLCHGYRYHGIAQNNVEVSRSVDGIERLNKLNMIALLLIS